MSNLQIKFPDQVYVGFQKRADDLLVGFMTPDGTDSAASKRKDTVDRWAASALRKYNTQTKSYDMLPAIEAKIYRNESLEGFRVGNSFNRSSSWNKCHDKWRIEDPRGFWLEVTSGNLEEILENCTIENGKIIGKLRWARLGANNILVPENSEVFVSAKSNTARIAKRVSLNNVKRGDYIVLHNGEEGIYLGGFYIVEKNNYSTSLSFLISNYKEIDAYLSSRGKKRYFLQKKDGRLHASSGFKVSSVEPREEMDIDLAEDIINDACQDRKIDSNDTIAFVTRENEDLKATRLVEENALFDEAPERSLFYFKIHNKEGMVRLPYHRKTSVAHYYQPIKRNGPSYILLGRNQYCSYHNSLTGEETATLQGSIFIYRHETATGRKIEVYL